jgi:hypothetical protein
MGRKRKYLTEEEKQIADREKSLRYYHKNKDKINKNKMVKYYEEREHEIQKKLSELRKRD